MSVFYRLDPKLRSVSLGDLGLLHVSSKYCIGTIHSIGTTETKNVGLRRLNSSHLSSATEILPLSPGKKIFPLYGNQMRTDPLLSDSVLTEDTSQNTTVDLPLLSPPTLDW